MTYLAFHALLVAPPIAALAWLIRSRGGSAERHADRYLAAVALIAVVYTTPWDNYLVYRGVWSYGDGRVIGTIGYVPVEEYLFFLLQPVLTGSWLYVLLSRSGSPVTFLATGYGADAAQPSDLRHGSRPTARPPAAALRHPAGGSRLAGDDAEASGRGEGNGSMGRGGLRGRRPDVPPSGPASPPRRSAGIAGEVPGPPARVDLPESPAGPPTAASGATRRRYRPDSPVAPSAEQAVSPRVPASVRAIGAGVYLAATVAGGLALRTPAGTYLGLILVWAAPVLALQWGYAGWEIWSMRRTWAAGVAVPTVYLWVADAIAIRSGVWRISDAHTIGQRIGPLPVEEAVFFLATNLLVVQGLILFLRPPRPRAGRAGPAGATVIAG